MGGYDVDNTTFASTGVAGMTVVGGNNGTNAVTFAAVFSNTGTSLALNIAGGVTGVSFAPSATSVTSGGTYTFKSVVDSSAASADDVKKYSGMEITVTLDSNPITPATYTVAATSKGNSVGLQVGSDNKEDQRIYVAVGDMSAKGLGVDTVDISDQESAQKAIDTIQSALQSVSATRADLGAAQNQLEHTNNNLSTMSENLTSAESQIRDVDMSDEYVQYSKNQILSQAATAMLAQANTQPQNVLTLLKG